MPRGMGSATPREWSTTAGRSLPEPEPAPVPEPAAAPAVEQQPAAATVRPAKPIRQTLDLPRDQYDAVHDAARALAREIGLTSKQVNGQTMLRALVARMVTDDELLNAVRQDVRNSVGK